MRNKREIQEFDPKEYWNITALFSKNGEFSAKLAEKEGRKITVTNGDDAKKIAEELKAGEFTSSTKFSLSTNLMFFLKT